MAVSVLLQSSFWKEVLANLGRHVVQGPGVISVVIYIRTLIWSGRSVLRWNENFHTVCANNSWKDMCIRASVDGQKHGWWKLYKQWILKITDHSSLHHLKCWFWGINKQQSYWTSETTGSSSVKNFSRVFWTVLMSRWGLNVPLICQQTLTLKDLPNVKGTVRL